MYCNALGFSSCLKVASVERTIQKFFQPHPLGHFFISNSQLLSTQTCGIWPIRCADAPPNPDQRQTCFRVVMAAFLIVMNICDHVINKIPTTTTMCDYHEISLLLPLPSAGLNIVKIVHAVQCCRLRGKFKELKAPRNTGGSYSELYTLKVLTEMIIVPASNSLHCPLSVQRMDLFCAPLSCSAKSL